MLEIFHININVDEVSLFHLHSASFDVLKLVHTHTHTHTHCAHTLYTNEDIYAKPFPEEVQR